MGDSGSSLQQRLTPTRQDLFGSPTPRGMIEPWSCRKALVCTCRATCTRQSVIIGAQNHTISGWTMKERLHNILKHRARDVWMKYMCDCNRNRFSEIHSRDKHGWQESRLRS